LNITLKELDSSVDSKSGGYNQLDIAAVFSHAESIFGEIIGLVKSVSTDLVPSTARCICCHNSNI